MAHQRHLFPCGNGKADVVQRGVAVAVAERHVPELDVAFDLFQLGILLLIGVGLLGFVVHDLGQALHRDGSLLDLELQIDQVAHRAGKVAGKGAEGHERAQGHLPIQDLHDADVIGQHAEPGGDQRGDQRLGGRELAGPDADLQAFDVLPFEPFQLVVLAGVALDGLDAAQALDHLAVEDGRLLHRLFVDLFVGAPVDQHKQQADQRHEQSDRKEGGVHPEQDDAGDDGHRDVHDQAQRDAGEDGLDGVGVGVTCGDIAGLACGKELHGQMVDVPKIAQHHRDIYFDGQMDQDPLPHEGDKCRGDADHAEHEDQGQQQVIQPVGQHLVHQNLVEQRGRNAQDGQDDRAENGVSEQLFLRQEQIHIPLEHTALFDFAGLEVSRRVQQKQHAGEVLVELVERHLAQLGGRVAHDDVFLVLVLLAGLVGLLLRGGDVQHMLAPRALVGDGRLFEYDHEVR